MTRTFWLESLPHPNQPPPPDPLPTPIRRRGRRELSWGGGGRERRGATEPAGRSPTLRRGRHETPLHPPEESGRLGTRRRVAGAGQGEAAPAALKASEFREIGPGSRGEGDRERHHRRRRTSLASVPRVAGPSSLGRATGARRNRREGVRGHGGSAVETWVRTRVRRESDAASGF